MNKKVIILGGGTFSHLRNHLSLSAPAFGNTARKLFTLCKEKFENMDVELILTKMADSNSNIIINDDVNNIVKDIINDNTVKVVFFNIALCDFKGQIEDIKSGKHSKRLETSKGDKIINITPDEKIIKLIREKRKDIFLIGFKTTCDDTKEEQFKKGLNLLKKNSCNVVLANDTKTLSNLIITPEEGVYGENLTRDECLKELVDISYLRTHLSFTRSTVVDGKLIDWNSSDVYPSLRTVVNYCISKGSYKEFNGATTGHFACKLEDNIFLTSIRKTNFNNINEIGMVKVKTDGDDNVISYGAKPSVGGQSQRIIFSKYENVDCIVHFHCPLKINNVDDIPVVSQKEYECGSHQCGENAAKGLEKFGNLYCVMLDKHGPNIIFNHNINSEEVIDFINRNFDLNKSTSGFEKIYMNLTNNMKINEISI